MHFHGVVELDRFFHNYPDIREMFGAYDLIRDLATVPGASVVAGHDPE